MTARALFLNGAVGVGKTSTLEAVGELLAEPEAPGALIDLDWLRKAWPTAPEDPFHSGLELANLNVVSANFFEGGAQVLALAAVIEHEAAREAYARAVGCPLLVIRLRLSRGLAHARLIARHAKNGAELEWHLARFDQLTQTLDDAGVDDAAVEVGDLDPRDVARRVVETANL